MIKEEYKNGCRLKEQVKYNIDYDDCQILNLTCANYIYDLVQESSKYETKLEDVKKMLYMIEKLLGHEVQYDIPEYHGDNKKCYFGVVSDNFVINEDNIKQLDYVLQDTKEFVKSFSTDYQKILYCYPNKFNSNNQSDPTTGKWVEQHEAVPADEEDITEQNGTLQLANKTYDKQSFSGLGRVYLRKNIVGDKNVLTQAMINKANTIYVIQYDYDLKEASINIPENCVLQFDGGSLSNGTIHGSLTKISNDSNAKIFDSISFTGTFSVIKIYANWFDNPEDDDISIAFRQAFELNKVNKLDNYSTITVLNGEYNCRGYILMGTSTILDFNGSIIHDLDIDTPCIFENKSSDPTLNYMQCGDIKATQNAPIIKNTLGEFNRLQIVKTSQQKKQSEALNHYTFDGTSVFDTDNIKPTWVYKETWYDSNGNPAYAEKTGTQYQRPANVKMGFYYFDTSLNKPIWKNSDTENVWIDATGATV